MDEGVGVKLAGARQRRGLELDRVEADTKIRVRYLRAIEAEEWDALPGEAYARGFLRTYAAYLGLDAEQLAEQHRRERGEARPGEALPRVDSAPQRVRGQHRVRISPRLLAVIVSVALVALLVAIGVFSGGGSGGGHGVAGTGRERHLSGVGERRGTGGPPPAPRSGHTLSLVANAEVWVCLLGAAGGALVDGRILAPGASEGPFRSGSFTFSLGNGEVTMTVDGKQAQIPATSSPIGYSVANGRLHPLPEGERPTCT